MLESHGHGENLRCLWLKRHGSARAGLILLANQGESSGFPINVNLTLHEPLLTQAEEQIHLAKASEERYSQGFMFPFGRSCVNHWLLMAHGMPSCPVWHSKLALPPWFYRCGDLRLKSTAEFIRSPEIADGLLLLLCETISLSSARYCFLFGLNHREQIGFNR